jgi:uncharacterized protein YndB with AHSA1/START domain
MEADILRYIGAVAREVTTRDHNGRPARVVIATCTYDTTIDDLWDALTNAERIPRWFLPISGDLRLGGRYQLQGNAGGEITTCAPPRNFAVTWEFGGQVSWLYVRLSELSDAGTQLKLEHVAHVPDELWAQYGPGAVGVGWDLTLMGLGRYLASGPNNPQQAAVWAASDEGKDFMRRSSDAWGRASIAGGTDEQAALAAATNASAFYAPEG